MKRNKLFLKLILLSFLTVCFLGIKIQIASSSKQKDTPATTSTSSSTPTSTSTPTTTSSTVPTSVSTPTATSTPTPDTTSTTPSSDATLKDLTVDGNTLLDFSSDRLIYSVSLPMGTTQVPVVNAVTNDSNATIDIIQADSIASSDIGIGIENQALVNVIAEDGITQESYAIVFYFQPDINADPSTDQSSDINKNQDLSLKNLMINGKTIENFDSAILTYKVSLPEGTTKIPKIGAMANDPNTTVNTLQANDDSLNFSSSIKSFAVVQVIASDGIHTQNYVVSFSVEKSKNISAPTQVTQQQNWCYNFNVNFGYQSQGLKVAALHTILKKENISYENDDENVYGEGTRSAVFQLQENHNSDILAPSGLTNGTGYVGSATRKYLNSWYGCK